MFTYSNNYGTYKKPYIGESQWQKPWGTVKEHGLKQFSAAFMGEVNIGVNRHSGSHADNSHPHLRNRLSALYGLYLDKGELYNDSFGCTLGVRYTIGG